MKALLDAPTTTTLAERTLEALVLIGQVERAHEATREALAAMTLERDAAFHERDVFRAMYREAAHQLAAIACEKPGHDWCVGHQRLRGLRRRRLLALIRRCDQPVRRRLRVLTTKTEGPATDPC